jgi:hypothetical protein
LIAKTVDNGEIMLYFANRRAPMELMHVIFLLWRITATIIAAILV